MSATTGLLRYIPRVLVVLAVLAAIGYTIHRVQTCQIAFVANPPNMRVSNTQDNTPRAGSSYSFPDLGEVRLVYPDEAIESEVGLKYESFVHNPDGTMTLVPLPPGSALQSILEFKVKSTDPHDKLSVKLANRRCTYPVMVKIYDPESSHVLYGVNLGEQPMASSTSIDMNNLRNHKIILLTAAMSPAAKNNWWCNLTISWTKGK